MKKIIYTSFTSFFIMMGTSSFAKGLRPEVTQMQDGKPAASSISALKAEVEKGEALAPARYNEVALDPSKARTDTEVIAALSAREVFVIVDQSGSMGEDDANPTGGPDTGWTKWKSAEVAVKGLAETMLALDRDQEIPVYFFQGYAPIGSDSEKNVTSIDMHSSKDITDAFSKRRPGGTTPLGQALEKLRHDHLDRLLAAGQPFTVVVLTDGVPDQPDRVENFFKKLVKDHNLSDPCRERLAAFTFVQQGDDSRAKEFLRHLDDDLKAIISADIIDTKEDNFIFGTQKGYTGQQGPVELLRQAVDD